MNHRYLVLALLWLSHYSFGMDEGEGSPTKIDSEWLEKFTPERSMVDSEWLREAAPEASETASTSFESPDRVTRKRGFTFRDKLIAKRARRRQSRESAQDLIDLKQDLIDLQAEVISQRYALKQIGFLANLEYTLARSRMQPEKK